MKRIVDFYLSKSLPIDVVVTGALCYCGVHLHRYFAFTFELKREEILSIVSSLISTCVSLAGFILAALTIIVTFKSNLKSKGIEPVDGALDIIFSSGHYPRIVKVFKEAILELTMVFILLYGVWQFNELVELNSLSWIALSAMIFTALSILRSLLLLFQILNLENFQKDQV